MKKLLSIVLTVLMLLTNLLNAFPVYAEWDGKIARGFSGGNGSETNPFIIKTENEFAYLNDIIANDLDSSSQYFKLEADLDFSNADWDCGTKIFDGHFDGNGHYILLDDDPLFYEIGEEGSLDMLTLEANGQMSQALVCRYNNGTITNTSVIGEWYTDSYPTYLSEFCTYNNGTMINCRGEIAVDSNAHYTAFVPYNYGLIKGCYVAYSSYDVYEYYERYDSYDGDALCFNRSNASYKGSTENNFSNQSSSYATKYTLQEMRSDSFLDILNESNSLDGYKWYFPSRINPLPEIRKVNIPSISMKVSSKDYYLYHTDNLVVEFNHPGNGIEVYYTTDGSSPISSPTRTLYVSGTSININSDVTFKTVGYNGVEYGPVKVQSCFKILGQGTQSNPYQIGTKAELNAVRYDTKSYYIQTQDIVFTDGDENWNPIEDFSGVYDGNGKKIVGIHSNLGGLFNKNSGTIKKIVLVDHKLFNDNLSYNGAIVSQNSGTVSSCYVKSAFDVDNLPTVRQGDSYVGGVVGYNSGTVTLCRNAGVVGGVASYKDGWFAVGGIVGKGSCTFCINEGTVKSASSTYLSYSRERAFCGAGGASNCVDRGEVIRKAQCNYSYYPGTFTDYNLLTKIDALEFIESKYPNTFDFTNDWMITKDGAEPQGVINNEGHCYVKKSYNAYTAPTCVADGKIVLYESPNTVEQVISALGHIKGIVEKSNVIDSTCTTSGSYTEDTYCGRCNQLYSSKKITTEELGHDIVNHKRVAPTYESDGTEEYWECNRCHKLYSDSQGEVEINSPTIIPMLVHNWGTPTYSWNDDYTKCTATRIDANDITQIETETVTATIKSSQNSTCTVAGFIVKEAEFKNSAFKTQTHEIKLELKDHDYVTHKAVTGTYFVASQVEYDYCSVCGHKNIKEINAESVDVNLNGINLAITSENDLFIDNISQVLFIDESNTIVISADNFNKLYLEDIDDGTYYVDIFSNGYQVIRKEFNFVEPNNTLTGINVSQDKDGNLIIEGNETILDSLINGIDSYIKLSINNKDIDLKDKLQTNSNGLVVTKNDLLNSGVLNKEYTLSFKVFGYKEYSKTLTIDNVREPIFNVTLNGNGGLFDDGNKKVLRISEDDKIPNNIIPNKLGYEFVCYTLLDGTAFDINTPIVDDIELNASWKIIEYKITYNLNGGTVSVDNLEKYTVETATFELNNPEADGCTFVGWSGTGLTGNTNKTVTISSGSVGDREYTANYSYTDYTITYNLYNGTNDIDNPSSYNLITPTIVLKDPSRSGYTFDGWYLESTYENKIVSIPSGSKGNISLHAKWVALTGIPYVVEHYKQELNGSYTLTDKENFQGSTDETVTPKVHSYTGFVSPESISVKISADGTTLVKYEYKRESYTLTINAGNGVNVTAKTGKYKYEEEVVLGASLKEGYKDLVYSGTTSDTYKIGASNATISISATPITYSISYDLNGGSASTNRTTYTVETTSFKLNNPSKIGYTFIGWSGTGLTGNSNTSVTISKGSIGDRTYVANYKPNTNTKYVVYHYIQDLNDSYSLKDKQTLYGVTDSNVTVNTLTYEGFSAPDKKNLLIKADGSASIDYYYTRNSYSVTLIKGKGIDSVSLSRSYKYDETVNLSATAKNGYENIKYSGDKDTSYFKMPAMDLTISVSASPIKYTITYHDKLNATNPNIKTYDIESNEIILIDISKDGYTFDGWYLQDTFVDRIYSIPSNKTGNIDLYAKWIANTYKITYELDGGINDENNISEHTYNTDSFELLPGQKEGYAFVGWYDEDDNKVTSIPSDLNRDITLTAKWEVMDYVVVYHMNGGTNNVKNKEAFNYESEDIELYDATRLGYKFAGWYLDELLTKPIAKIVKNTANNLDLYASWTPITYIVRFNLNDAKGEMADQEFKYDVSQKLSKYVDEDEFRKLTYWEDSDGNRYNDEQQVKNLCENDGDIITLNGRYELTKTVATPKLSYSNYETLYRNSVVYATCDTPGAVISYSINGGKYESYTDDGIRLPKDISEISITVRAKANNYNNSNEVTYNYIIQDTYIDIENVDDLQYYTKNIDNCQDIWISPIEDQVYTGKAIVPTIRVYDKTKLLVSGTDYSVKCSNNTKVGVATITITGVGNYNQSCTSIFNIVKKPVVLNSIANVYMVETGKALKLAAPKVMFGSTTLKNNTDYTYEIDRPLNEAGEYTVTIKCVSPNYSFDDLTYKVFVQPTKKYKISAAKITNFVSSLPYSNGEEVVQNISLVHSANTELVDGLLTEEDYEINYLNNTSVGTATMIIIGKGNYYGTVSKTYKINGTAINKAKVEGLLSTYTYTGTNIEPTFDVYLNNEKLEKECYDVVYTNNIKAGSATITITGKGGYTGSIKKTFKITPVSINVSMVGDIDDCRYQNGGVKPDVTVKFNGKTLILNTDYTLAYKNNAKCTTAGKLATVTVKGKGNYSGSITKEFEIYRSDISDLQMVIPDVVASTKSNSLKVNPLIYDNGKTLKSKTDFLANIEYYYNEDITTLNGEIRYKGDLVESSDIIPVGASIKAKVTGTGNYTGTNSEVFRIVKTDISKAKIVAPTMTYTGKSIVLTNELLTVTVGKEVLSTDDYEIVAYTNNKAKGSATISIRGVGNYGGVATGKFSIVSKPMCYSVNFYGMGATSGSMKQLLVKNNTTLTKNSFKKTGYTFLGWSTSVDADSVDYNDGAVISYDGTKYGQSLNLYAVWKPIEYRIKYLFVDGSYIMSDYYKYEEKIEVSDFGYYDDEGYNRTTKEWNTKSAGKGVGYKVGDYISKLTLVDDSVIELYQILQMPKVENVEVLKKSYEYAYVTWDVVPGATGYNIYRSTKPNDGFKQIASMTSYTGINYYRDYKASAGTTYYYYVEALMPVTYPDGIRQLINGIPSDIVSGRSAYKPSFVGYVGHVSGSKYYTIYIKNTGALDLTACTIMSIDTGLGTTDTTRPYYYGKMYYSFPAKSKSYYIAETQANYTHLSDPSGRGKALVEIQYDDVTYYYYFRINK